jgi:hypothetical protein
MVFKTGTLEGRNPFAGIIRIRFNGSPDASGLSAVSTAPQWTARQYVEALAGSRM